MNAPAAVLVAVALACAACGGNGAGQSTGSNTPVGRPPPARFETLVPGMRDATFDPGIPPGAPSVIRVRPARLADLLRRALRGSAGRSPGVRLAESAFGLSSGALADGRWPEDLGLDRDRDVVAAVLPFVPTPTRPPMLGMRLVLPVSGVDAAEGVLYAMLRERGFQPAPVPTGLDAFLRHDGNATEASSLATIAHRDRTVVLDVFAAPWEPGEVRADLPRLRAALEALHTPSGVRPSPSTVSDQDGPALTARWDFAVLARVNEAVLAARAAGEGDATVALANLASQAGVAQAAEFPSAEVTLRAGTSGDAVLEFVAHAAQPLRAGPTEGALEPVRGGRWGDVSLAWLHAWPATHPVDVTSLGGSQLFAASLPFIDALGGLLALPWSVPELAREQLQSQRSLATPFVASDSVFERAGVLLLPPMRDGGASDVTVLVGLLPQSVGDREARCALARLRAPCTRVALPADGSIRTLPGGGLARSVTAAGRIAVLVSTSRDALQSEPVRPVPGPAPEMQGDVPIGDFAGGYPGIRMRGEVRGSDWIVTLTTGGQSTSGPGPAPRR